MKMYKSKSRRVIIWSMCALVSFLFISYANYAKAVSPTIKGDGFLRVGVLGGEISINDPTNPLYGAGISFGVTEFLTSDREFTRFQIDSAGKIKNDKNGNPRILTVKPTGKTKSIINGKVELKSTNKKKELLDVTFTRPEVVADKAHSQILILYIDSDGDGTADKFPAYFIKKVKFKTYKLPKPFGEHFPKDEFNPPIDVYFKKSKLPVFETYSDLPETGKIILIQVLETPEVRVAMKEPIKIKKAEGGGNIIGIGPQVNFSAVSSYLLGTVALNNPDAIAPGSFTGKITVPYSKDALSSLGKTSGDVLLYRLGDKSQSVTIESSDESKGTVSANVTTFGTFQAVVETSGSTNAVPEILELKTKVKKNKVLLKYKLGDAEGKASDVKIEYRQSPGNDADTGWTEIKTIKGVKPSTKKFKEFTWNASSIGDISGYFQVRVTPVQTIAGSEISGAARVSEVFSINTSGAKIARPGGLKGEVTNFDDNEIDDSGDESKPPQVSLEWNPNSGDVTGYNIYRKARFRTGDEKTYRKIGSTSDTTFTDSKDNSTLTQSFYEALYKLTAYDSSGNESKFSKVLRLASIVFGSYGYYGK